MNDKIKVYLFIRMMHYKGSIFLTKDCLYFKSFSPTAPAMIQHKKTILFQLADTLKNKMPISTAPAAPKHVQTAYAVPNDMPRIAKERNMKQKLNVPTINNSLCIVRFCK